MNFLRKIISLFKKDKCEDIGFSEQEEQAIEELNNVHESAYKHLPKWEDVPVINCSTDKKRILIMDDYNAVTKVVKEDLEIIFNKEYDKRLTQDTIRLIEKLRLKASDIEICDVSSDLAPYIVYKSCTEGVDDCKFDFAIIDIIFGEYINKNNSKFYMDGIDVAEFLLKENPDIKIIFFTGCFLDGVFNREKDKIIEKLGEKFFSTNVLKKTDDRNKRIQFLIKRLFNEYIEEDKN